jgi:predicted NAD-dependent protein-ADP-ribosyltransferase YbiA (DUF1768 family)
MDQIIKFDQPEEFGFLSNIYESEFIIDGLKWFTVSEYIAFQELEHYRIA